MTEIVWDDPGSRVFETGIDHGVLYLDDNTGVPWNGLVSVNESLSDQTVTPLYYDGVKTEDYVRPADYSATLSAFTYPDEFLNYEGIVEATPGFFLTSQRPKKFGLSYRTKVGNDNEGIDLGYKIHLLYNLTATIDTKNYQTISDSTTPFTFAWKISGVPGIPSGFRPTSHLIFDSRFMESRLLESLEEGLYGTSTTPPTLPAFNDLVDQVVNYRLIKITDNGDGSWSATGPDDLITMLSSTEFQIQHANAVYTDADTYQITSTYKEA